MSKNFTHCMKQREAKKRGHSLTKVLNDITYDNLKHRDSGIANSNLKLWKVNPDDLA